MNQVRAPAAHPCLLLQLQIALFGHLAMQRLASVALQIMG